MVMKGVQLSHLWHCTTMCSYIFVIISVCKFRCCVADDKIFIGMLTRFRIPGSIVKTSYSCIVNSPEFDVTVSTRRVISTRANGYDTDRNPEPPSPSRRRQATFPYGAFSYFVSLNDFDENFEFGTYACDVSWGDGLADYTTSVSNIIMLERTVHTGHIYPADGMVTQTVNTGDNGAIIEMTVRNVTQDRLSWRRNEDLLMMQSTSNPGTYNISHTIQKSDAGVYICHETNHFGEARHGMQRLIVRGCQANRWGPNCDGICDNCYNGGICDDETGRCVCPPGSIGTNCLHACWRNVYGNNCDLRSSYTDIDSGSRRLQFCLVDPYGCSCSPGITGWNCDIQGCEMGKFGASCRQDCHCLQGDCDDFTGRCQGACGGGWSGWNCQIPDICPSDYYGPECVEKCHCKDDAPCDKETGECPEQECSPGYAVYSGNVSCEECQEGYFGDFCQEECHCEDSACDKVTGACSGQCKPQWVNNTDCEEGLVSSEGGKVNPNTAAQVSCTAERSNSTHRLSRKWDEVDQTNITTLPAISLSDDGIMTRTTLFQVDDVNTEEQLYCLLTSQTGKTIYAFLPVNVSVYVLPELTYPPEQVNVTSSEVTIHWIAWDPDTDVGDAPVVAYVLYYRRNSSDEWISDSSVQSEETLEYTVADLDADTSYVFAVAAVREGSGGEGPRGSPMIVKTLCDVPGPVTSVHAHLTLNNTVNISWELPTGELMCSTGVTSYKVYYRIEGSTDDTPQLAGTVEDDDATSLIIDDELLEPESSYIFFVTVTTYQESNFSESNAIQTPAAFISDNSFTPGYVLTLMVIIPLVLLVAVIVVFFIVRFRRKNPKDKKITNADDHEDTGYAIAAMQKDPQDYIALENQSRDISSSKYEAIPEKSQGSSSTPLQYEVTIFPEPQKQIGKFRIQTKSMEGVDTNAYGVEAESDSRQFSDVPQSHPSVEEDEENNYIVPDRLEEYTGFYINLKDKSKRVPPGPIKVAEFEMFMSRNKEDVVSDIVQQFMALPSGERYPWKDALKFQNKPRNFFKSILPYDHSRVRLDTNGSDARSDYINASYIKCHDGKMSFIAAQGPQEHTVDDFWKMVWQENVETIVMVTDISEGDKIFCCTYWPSKVHMSEVYDDITVLLMESTSYTTHTIRKLNLLKGDHKAEVHTVTQVQVHFWQYGSVPKEPASLISIIKKVKSLQTDGSSAPMLVHCSNGVGATGTFIAAYVLMDVIKKNKEISVFEFVKRMRDDRVDMVQTRVQYLFVFEVLLAALQSTDSEMSCDQLKKVDYSGIRQKSKKEFKVLQESIAKGQHPDSYIGSSPENQHKNRFKNLIPDDKHRPVLKSEGNSISSNSYINAFHLVNFSGREFIMTQSPLSSTVEDFWRLVYDYECTTIVMLNTVDGSDETVVQYWPGSGGTQYGYMKVECTNTTKNDMCIHREFQLSHEKVKEKSVSVNHFAFCGWSGNQPDISKLMEFIRCTGSKDGQPLLVHCMNGVGLSAVYIIVKTESKRLEKDGFVDVFQSLKKMRMNCPPAIQTEEHYTLCYQLLKDHLNNPEEYAVVY